MTKSTFFLLIMLVSGLIGSKPIYAQKEANVWLFGNKVGINFNSNPPRAFYGGMTTSYHGHTSMADPAGNLLFYMNGGISYPASRVYDRRHVQMQNNGFGVNYGVSGSRNNLMVPWPGQPGKAFMFGKNPNNEVYSVIDVNLNNGFGNVLSKNNNLTTLTKSDFAGLQHQNNRDFWVILQQNQLNIFKSFLVSPSGLNLTPVISNVTGVPTANPGQYINPVLKASPDGTTLAFAEYANSSPHFNQITLLNFNNATGQVSLRGTLPADSAALALEFSSDGTKLYAISSRYISPGVTHSRMVQYDLNAGSPAAIHASRVTIFRGLPFNGFSGVIQLGPDGKIYIVNTLNTKYLHVINRPNLKGLACQFRAEGFDVNPLNIAGVSAWGAFPSFVQSYFYRPKNVIRQACAQDKATFTLGNNARLDSVKWNFGDPGSGNLNFSEAINPDHFYAASGTYSVQAIVYFNHVPDTVNQTIIIPKAISKPNLGPDRDLCPGDKILLNAFQSGATYQWQDTLHKAPTFTVTAPGTYWVKISNGCNVRYDSVNITVKQPLTRFQDTTICTGDNFMLKAPAGLRYRWNTADTTQQISISKAGFYKVEIETIPGCFFRDSVTVKEERCFRSVFIQNIVTPNNDNLNDHFEPKGLEPGSWELNLYNRWGKLLYKEENYTNQWPENEIKAGTYYYLLRNAQTGKTYKGWVEVGK